MFISFDKQQFKSMLLDMTVPSALIDRVHSTFLLCLTYNISIINMNLSLFMFKFVYLRKKKEYVNNTHKFYNFKQNHDII
ncbi:hypothetical protein V1478_008509 [Vespula squamosa]|uniref:Uncharacterized protein n=1 Tax=Vespula squamosa TaxID=30214 RepID=A0ABD2AUC7_VESSQ